jgi:cytochrome c
MLPVLPDVERLNMKATICTPLVLLLALGSAAKAQEPEGLVEKGAAAYRLCAACHSLMPGIHLSGPSLAEVWGKRAATNAGFRRYTEALKKADIVWDENTLNAWLADPQAMVPGTTMTARGIGQNETRANLIAFLRLALGPGGVERVVKDGLISAAMAEGQRPPDLSTVGANQRIKEIRHCRDTYYITTADGAQFPFWELNVRLKTDSSLRGPKAGEPVLMRSGMAGDRVSVVFASLAEIARIVGDKC